MLRTRFRIWLLVLILLLGAASTFFFLRSRMDLVIAFEFHQSVSEDLLFQFQLRSVDTVYEFDIQKGHDQVSIPAMKYGFYTFQITHQGMALIRASADFQTSFGFLREENHLHVELPDLSEVSNVQYQLNDPWIQIRWQVQNLLELKPFQYRVRVGNQQWLLSANFLEVDARALLDRWDREIPISIEPVNRQGQSLILWESTIPLKMGVLRFDFPPQFDLFEIRVDIMDQRFQMDPYQKTVHVPLLETMSSIPIQVVYYDEPILESVLTPSDFAHTFVVAEIPYATITSARMEEDTLHLTIDRESFFLANYFDSYLVEWLGREATTTKHIAIPEASDTFQVLITPQYGLGVTSKTTAFDKHPPPRVLMGTNGQTDAQHAKVHIATLSKYPVQVQYRINRGDWLEGLVIDHMSIISIPFRSEDVLRFDVSVTDWIGQTASSGKWIDPNLPATTEFESIEIVDEVLHVRWLDMLEVYDLINLVLSDGSRIHTYPVQTSPHSVDLSQIILRRPFRVILRGVLEGREFTMAVRENVE